MFQLSRIYNSLHHNTQSLTRFLKAYLLRSETGWCRLLVSLKCNLMLKYHEFFHFIQVSTLHRPKNDIMAFFKFLQKKVSRLDKKAPALHIVLGVVIWKNCVAKPIYSFNKCRKFILSRRETFFCRNLKNVRMSFLGQCNVETASSFYKAYWFY